MVEVIHRLQRPRFDERLRAMLSPDRILLDLACTLRERQETSIEIGGSGSSSRAVATAARANCLAWDLGLGLSASEITLSKIRGGMQ
jgi:hypothetical protein